MRALFVSLLLVAAPPLAAADPIIGERAPALGDAALGGGVVLVDFFATWCEPCHEAMAALDDIVKRRGVALVVVDVGEPPERVQAWFAGHPLPAGARLITDPAAAAARRWGQHRFPTTFVLRDGTIRHINRGFGPGYARRMDGWVEKELTP
ncbi:MAG TPA: TlpA disulfide reductase family protein [Polyangia bacterium]